jgi:hypothetical protein
MNARRLAAASVLALALVACGDDDGEPILPVNDAGADVRPGGDAMVWPGTCDPVRQNCPAGQQCVGGCNVVGVMAKAFTCATPRPGAGATNGQPCGEGCAPGHDCYVVPAGDGGTRSICRRYCNGDADCPGGSCGAEGLVCAANDPAPVGRLCSY